MSTTQVLISCLPAVLLLSFGAHLPVEVIANSSPCTSITNVGASPCVLQLANPCGSGQAGSSTIVNVITGGCTGLAALTPSNSVQSPSPCPNTPLQPSPCQNTPVQPSPCPTTPVESSPCPNTPVQPNPCPNNLVHPNPNPNTPLQPNPCPNTPIQPSPSPNTPVLPNPCPNTPVFPIPNVPIQPSPCPNTPVHPNPNPNTPLQPNPCPNTPIQPSPSPNTPNLPNPCPNTPVVPIPNVPIQPSPCPNTPVQPAPCLPPVLPTYPPTTYAPPTNPPPTYAPPTYPPTTYAPPTYPPPTYAPPTYPPPTYAPPPTYPPPTYPTPTPTTTPPPAPIIMCPHGTILVKGICRLVFCGTGQRYVNGRCMQTRCPQGYVWTGLRCDRPKIKELGNIHLETTILSKATGQLVTNNVNNVNVDAPISIPGHDYDEEEEDVEKIPPPPGPSTVPCCSVIAPRICSAPPNGTGYKCASRSQQQCGSICQANKMVLTPSQLTSWTMNNNQMLVMPPNWGQGQACQAPGSCQQTQNFYDCSGCGRGDVTTCSSYCYTYRCSGQGCAFYDQGQYCAQYPGQIGCRTEDGWFQ
ncbi:leucine-rich repeat extensin-like protein 5 [Drosophila pseudoobscura]|uniref:Leucine-rich repeat extensin-like protein 5 n=1 Tax=Drosophila pseudoobscura pseudoobscura TaxID=46245 RepID=A0A6I8VMM7_DROPS|nr:leucine-rich repeat extensin-like protein 5 [Drosophila pseudoobscura]